MQRRSAFAICLALSYSPYACADRFGINESDAGPSGSPLGTAFWIILGVVGMYFGYRWLVHDEETPLLGVLLTATICSMAFGILYFIWLVITK